LTVTGGRSTFACDAAADATLKFALTTSAVNGTGKASSSSSKYDFQGNENIR
jgi:hypothetical protein